MDKYNVYFTWFSLSASQPQLGLDLKPLLLLNHHVWTGSCQTQQSLYSLYSAAAMKMTISFIHRLSLQNDRAHRVWTSAVKPAQTPWLHWSNNNRVNVNETRTERWPRITAHKPKVWLRVGFRLLPWSVRVQQMPTRTQRDTIAKRECPNLVEVCEEKNEAIQPLRVAPRPGPAGQLEFLPLTTPNILTDAQQWRT